MDDPNEASSSPNLVGLIKSWITWRSEPSQVSRDFWMPDRSCRVCYECDSLFTFFNRRHHCRLCGRIFCANCASHWLPAPSRESLLSFLHYQDSDTPTIRVCDYCHKQWQLEAKNGTCTVADIGLVGSILKSSDEDSSSYTVLSLSQSAFSPNHTLVMDTASDAGKSPTEMSNESIVDNWLQPQLGLFQNRNEYDKGENFGASSFGSLTSPLSDVFYFEHLRYDDDTGNEYTFSKVHPDGEDIASESTSVSVSPLLLDSISPLDTQQAAAHKDFDHIIGDEYEAPSSLYVAQDVEMEPVDFESNALLWLPPEPEDADDDLEALFIEDDDDEIENDAGEWGYSRSSGSFGNEEHKRGMKPVLDSHFRALVTQLLQVENIFDGDENNPGSWLEIITALSWEAATMLKPDMSTGGQMDPGGYVKVKCLASGHRSESMVVKGVVCKKNVAHRRMASKFEKARLLILGGALEYQRVSTALSSIDTLLQQEMEHLKMAVAKIDAHHPDVLLVEKSVSRYAQEYLLAKDISLVLNIKRPQLERIARCTGGQIVPSLDHLSSPKLGNCDMFRVEKFLEEHGSAGQSGKKLVKTLMYFEDCPKPFGCTIILKGANGDELKKVKHVLHYGVFAAYHLALETSFLADEGASLPVLPLETPMTVALPDKPSSVDKSISTVPNFRVPGSEKSIFEPLSLNTSPVSYTTDTTVASVKENEFGKMSEVFDPSGNHGLEKTGHVEFFLSSESDRLATEGVSRIINDLRDSHAKAVGGNGDFDQSNLNLPLTGKQVEQQPSFKEELPTSSSENQSILVSLSSRCVWKGTVCERAHLFRIKYYGNFDKPLGRYLRDDLFNEGYRCRSCDMPTEAHIQCYTHWQGTLTISVKKMQEGILPGEKDGKIWMWHRCLKCERTNGFPPATRRVVMSDAAWGLSFGKFLELSFSNHAAASRVASCGHSLHRDCLRFYGFGKMVACFRYASIDVHSVYLPPAKLNFNFESQEWIEKEMNELVARGNLLFSEVLNVLSVLVEQKSNIAVESKCRLAKMEALLQKEKAEFEESINKIVNEGAKKGELICDILNINQLRRQLVFQAYVWDQRLVNEESRMNTKQICEKSGEAFCSSHITASDARIAQSYHHPEVLTISSTDAPMGVESIESYQGGVITKNDYAPTSPQTNNCPKELDSIEDSTSWLGMSFTNFYRSLNKNFTGSAQKLDMFREYTPVHFSSFQESELEGGARFLLPVGMDDMVIPVYDDEPTSVISYALLLPSYRARVSDNKATENSNVGPDLTSAANSGGFAFSNSLDESALESFKGVASGDEAMFSSGAAQHSSLPSDSILSNLHPRVSFVDNGPLGKVKYSVKCYYAKQFESLRKICCPSETDFVRSLSRCKKWGAQGGKSNVFFAKTLDDRFIIKQVTKTELESFLKFGARYFHYLTESIRTGSPTCLAKILGIYQVASKHLKGGRETKMDMLVMENLLFGRNVTRLYDLKGSTRSRYNPDSSGTNKVLLDQNLIEAMPTSPIFVGNKAKRILERAVWNDTAFLASIDVMDYSLLVGVDSANKELVLGIIDFMRQYTWDKHLETWVKASGILGGSKNATPTIISPKQYKIRFRKAMTTYFLMVPDQWSPPAVVPSKSQTDLVGTTATP